MNKSCLFLIMSIGAVFVTASMFGSTITSALATSALAQGNETGEVQVGEPLFLQPTDNMTMSNMTNNNVTTAVGDLWHPDSCCFTRCTGSRIRLWIYIF